jgi:hypothetical protein
MSENAQIKTTARILNMDLNIFVEKIPSKNSPKISYFFPLYHASVYQTVSGTREVQMT